MRDTFLVGAAVRSHPQASTWKATNERGRFHKHLLRACASNWFSVITCKIGAKPTRVAPERDIARSQKFDYVLVWMDKRWGGFSAAQTSKKYPPRGCFGEDTLQVVRVQVTVVTMLGQQGQVVRKIGPKHGPGGAINENVLVDIWDGRF